MAVCKATECDTRVFENYKSDPSGIRAEGFDNRERQRTRLFFSFLSGFWITVSIQGKTLKKKQSDMELDTDVQIPSEPSTQTSSAIDSDGGAFDKVHSTPPTSDPIDVDMLPQEDLGKSVSSRQRSMAHDAS